MLRESGASPAQGAAASRTNRGAAASPAQVGQRFFEIFATGTTLCLCNRLPPADAAAYASLGIADGVHALMFSSVPEFVGLVVNYTTDPAYEPRRRAIVRNARLLARNYTWRRQAKTLGGVLDGVRHRFRR